MILGIKTDQPQAELVLDQNGKTTRHAWESGRKLNIELLPEIQKLLDRSNIKLDQLTGLAVFQGPGSFTGLRIGLTVANTLAYSLSVPIVGSTGQNWFEEGSKQIPQTDPGQYVMPEYGSAPHVTKPNKQV